MDPLCFGGCDPFVDPSCGTGGGGGSGFAPGTTPEKPRPFPWPQLPIGFFSALEDDQSDQKPKPTCKIVIRRPGMSGVGLYDPCPSQKMRLMWAADCEGDVSCCRTEIPKYKDACESPNGQRNPVYKFIMQFTVQLNTGWCCRKMD
jgi:hypothetical protein